MSSNSTPRAERSDSGASRKGLVIVFTGDGKGKTTAALGMTLRAAGHGMRVRVIQFIKGAWPTGEAEAIGALSPYVDFDSTGRGFFLREAGAQEGEGIDHAEAARNGLCLAMDCLRAQDYDVVVLDEILIATSLGLIAESDVLRLVQSKPSTTHLVLTGRWAPQSILAIADLITDMRCVRHPYQQGILAQPGVEF